MKTVVIQKQLLKDLRVAILDFNKVNRPKLKLDVAVYFVNLLNSIPTFYREEEQSDNISLSSQRLKKYHSKYNLYLEFLMRFEFITKVKNYGADISESNSFKLSSKYEMDKVESYAITDKTFIKALNGDFQKEKNEFCEKTRPHLVKFFDEKLTINTRGAYSEIKHFIDETETRRKYISSSVIINEFDNKEWKYSIKPHSDNRIHSNLTRSSKVIRKHIKYDSKSIMGVDLKTSQPFFLCVVIKAILTKNKGLLEQVKATDILSDLAIESLFNLELDREELIYFVLTVLKKDFYSEFEKILTIKYDDDNDIPYRMVSNYSSSKKKRSRSKRETKKPKRKVTFKTSRDLVKAVIMEIFYSKPKTTVTEALVFRKAYPSVAKIFRCLHENKVKFSYLLQYVEAFVLLDYVAKEIHYEYPEMPLFSIHDALVTTEPWICILEEEMKKHIIDITTLAPKLDIEDWIE